MALHRLDAHVDGLPVGGVGDPELVDREVADAARLSKYHLIRAFRDMLAREHRQRVRRIFLLHRLQFLRRFEPQQAAHHHLHLVLGGGPGADHRLLDLERGVFKYREPCVGSCHDGGAPRLRQHGHHLLRVRLESNSGMIKAGSRVPLPLTKRGNATGCAKWTNQTILTLQKTKHTEILPAPTGSAVDILSASKWQGARRDKSAGCHAPGIFCPALQGNFGGAALREAWQRRNEMPDGCEVIVISPEQEEEDGF